MLTNLTEQAPDKILALGAMFRADTRDTKLDLGVGVYKDSSGITPVMRAIKAAEKQLWNSETTKTYTSLIGDGGYHQAMSDLIVADSVAKDRLAFAHTPGGTGAVRQIFELAQLSGANPTIWVSDPTWPNHLTILKYLGIEPRIYPYFDSETKGVAFDAMMETLADVKAGDIVLLHGCCHNPTGANLNPTEWNAVADLMLEKGAIPFIDIAYQGFGDGLSEDAFGVRLLASKVPEMLIAASCSKNFGIYRERAGLVIALAPDAATAKTTQGNLSYLNRQNFSFPPDHGARMVTMILTNDELRTDWMAELEEMRLNMLNIREKLAAALQTESGSDRFGFVAQHRGMFSRMGATPEQVVQLREEHAIYMVGDSRVNIAGVNLNAIPQLAKALVAVGA